MFSVLRTTIGWLGLERYVEVQRFCPLTNKWFGLLTYSYILSTKTLVLSMMCRYYDWNKRSTSLTLYDQCVFLAETQKFEMGECVLLLAGGNSSKSAEFSVS